VAELTAQLKRTVRRNRSTLIFGNSKRMVEKVARFLNEARSSSSPTRTTARCRARSGAWSRSGSSGSLRAIVATNSLELGIDIGSIDEVVLVQPRPPSPRPCSASAAGHKVGRPAGVGCIRCTPTP